MHRIIHISPMHRIICIVGAVVLVIALLSLVGLR